MEGVKRAGLMWVAVVVVVVAVFVSGASARLVINRSGAPISIELASSVSGDNNNQSAVVVGQQSRLMLPEGFVGSSLLVRNQLTGGVFGPFTLRRNSAMLIQSTGLLSGIVTVLLGTIIKGVITALTTLVAGL